MRHAGFWGRRLTAALLSGVLLAAAMPWQTLSAGELVLDDTAGEEEVFLFADDDDVLWDVFPQQGEEPLFQGYDGIQNEEEEVFDQGTDESAGMQLISDGSDGMEAADEWFEDPGQDPGEETVAEDNAEPDIEAVTEADLSEIWEEYSLEPESEIAAESSVELRVNADPVIEGLLRPEDGFGRVFSNGTLTLTLDTSPWDDAGVPYLVTWFVSTPSSMGERIFSAQDANAIFTLANAGKTLTFLGEIMSQYTDIREQGGVCVTAYVQESGASASERRKAEAWVEFCDPEVEYEFPYGESQVVLPEWGWRMNNWMEAWVKDTEHPDGEWINVPVTNVTVNNDDPQTPVLYTEKHEWGEGDSYGCYWDYWVGRHFGSARLTMEYLSVYGEPETFEGIFYVEGDVYNGEIYSNRGNPNRLLLHYDDSLRVKAEHEAFSEEQGNHNVPVDNLTYVWELAPGTENILSVRQWEDAPNVATIDGIKTGSGQVICRVFDPDAGTEEPVLVLTYDVSVEDSFTGLYPAWYDFLRNLYPGTSYDLPVRYIRYFQNEQYGWEESVEDVRFRWEFNSDEVEIFDADGNRLVGTHNEDEEYVYTPKSYGSGAVFTLHRITPYGCGFRLVAEVPDEEGNYYEENANNYWFDGYGTDIWLEGTEDGPVVFDNGQLSLNVNTDQLNEWGREYTLEWRVGPEWDDGSGLAVPLQGDYYTISDEGHRITLDGEKMAALPAIRNRDGVEVQVIARFADGSHEFELDSDNHWVWLRDHETRYDYPYNDYEVMLPYWEWHVDSWFNGWIRDQQHPDGEDFGVKVLNVTVDNPDPDSPSVELRANDNGDGEADWDLIATRNMGTATVTLTYLDPEMREQTWSFTVEVAENYYGINVESEDGTDFLQPGASLVLEADTWHEVYFDRHHETWEIKNPEYFWEVNEGSEDLLSISRDPGDPQTRIRVTASADVEDNWEAAVRLTVYETNDHGETYEVGKRWFWIHVYPGYSILMPARTQTSRLPVGSTMTITPQYLNYEPGQEPEEVRNVRFRWNYDANAVLITDGNGETVGLRDDQDEYIYTRGSYYAGASFTIRRLETWGTNLFLAVEELNEDGEWEDTGWNRNYWLDDVSYNVWFDDMDMGDHTRVFTDGEVTFSLDAHEPDGDGASYYVEWHVGEGWDEEGNLLREMPGNYFYTLNNGRSIHFNGAFMNQMEEIRNLGRVDVMARLIYFDDYCDEVELARCSGWVELREPEKDYHWPMDEYFPQLPNWDYYIGDGFTVWERNSSCPDGRDTWLTITNVSVSNEDEQNPAVTLETFRDAAGTVTGWNIHSNYNLGDASVQISYIDLDGQEKIYTAHVSVGGEVFHAWLETVHGGYRMHPGESVQVEASVNRWTYSAEEGHGGPDMDDAIFEIYIPEDSEWLLMLDPQAGDTDRIKTVKAIEGQEGNGRVEMAVLRRNARTGRNEEVARADCWLEVREDYWELLPDRLESTGLDVGQTVTPVYQHRYLEEWNGKTVKMTEQRRDVRFRWNFSPGSVEIYDADGTLITYDEQGEYVFTPASYASYSGGNAYTIKRLTRWGTEISLTVQEKSEDIDGLWIDLDTRNYHLDEISYYIWFEGHNTSRFPDTDTPLEISTKGTTEVTVNTSQMDADGFDYTLSWVLGYEDEDDNWQLKEAPGAKEFYTVSADGRTITIDGEKMRQNDWVKNHKGEDDEGGILIVCLAEYQGERLTGWADWAVMKAPKEVPVTGIVLTPKNTDVTVTKTLKLTAEITPSDATNQKVTWTSADTKLATVDQNGVVTGLKVGKTTITATTEDGQLTAEATVHVLFDDVPRGVYYTNPVYWAGEMGITNGMADADDGVKDGMSRIFGTGLTCTRGQIVTFLWRSFGKPEPSAKTMKNNKFKDIKSSDYYYKAVLWAVEKGITNGYADDNYTTFRPDAECLREHAVTFLWRAAGKPEPSSKTVSSNRFKDIKKTDYYYKAVLWAVEKGITNGYADDNYTTFRPKASCLREQIVTFLWRYQGKPAPAML